MRARAVGIALLGLLWLAPATSAQQRSDGNPHGKLRDALDCSACHTPEAWKPARAEMDFDHARTTGFRLTGKHALATCAACHTGLRFDRPRVNQLECGACHNDVHQGRQGSECAACHNSNDFRDAGGVDAHSRTNFPLTGAHLQISCEACHVDDAAGAFTSLDITCSGCHESDYRRARGPDHAGQRFPMECERCHETVAWQGATFDHTSLASFELLGRHASIACTSCHSPGDFAVLFQPSSEADCVACHEADWQREHAGAGFPRSCADCHDQQTWERGTFDHAAAGNGFALIGGHARLACTGCHSPTDFAPMFSAANHDDCVACHRAGYDREHGGSGYPLNCARCHDAETWTRGAFDHAAVAAAFPLAGAHNTAPCTACHAAADFHVIFQASGPNDCVACHRADYDREHAGSGYPTACKNCHGVEGWDAAFDHTSASGGFELVGRHSQLDCAACHDPVDFHVVFAATSKDDCIACHRGDYDREHTGSGYPTLCTHCHGVEAWSGAVVDHAALADGFALVGRHASAPCTACHIPPDNRVPWTAASENDCVACHRADYDREHAGSGYPIECARCHAVDRWDGAVFDHAAAANGYELEGRHGQLECTACHVPPDNHTRWTPAGQDDCATCHRADYDREHAGSGYPVSCRTCHGVETWATTFDHSAASNGFALVGRHSQLDCAACHAPPDFRVIFTATNQDECVACHRGDYDREHTGSGYPTNCMSCHNVDAWTGAVFDHAGVANGYTLVGAHATQPCSACHAPPDFHLIYRPAGPSDCIACHRLDFDREHTGTGYPTTCLTCHNQVTFTGALFNHDGQFFPIYSGKHAQKWNVCADCHPSPADFGTFTCLTCHTLQETNNDHSEVTGYAYDSARCLSCHPRGD